jgi:hypothetical protein
MESIFDNARVLLNRGLISLSLEGEGYMVQAMPPIQELSLSKESCGYDEFWKIGKELAGWACGTISLQRLNPLKEAASVRNP